jgi:ubiquinone/menaquinone biosynthesis C-methylase UbiE
MSTSVSPEMLELKTRLKQTWEDGDFSQVAKHIEAEAKAFVDRLNVGPGAKVLDVACGSGNSAIEFAADGAEVTGLDLASNLLEVAAQRAKAAGLDLRLDQGDAEDLPYEDNSFDLVATMYGAMFAPRPEVVASELVRVCRPGGRVAMANWTPDGFAGQMFKVASRYLTPPNMPAPAQWGVEDVVRQRFGDSFSDLKMTKRMADMSFEFPPKDVVALFRKYFGPVKRAFEKLEGEQAESYRKDLEEVWTQHNTAPEGKTLVKSEYLEVVGVKK